MRNKGYYLVMAFTMVDFIALVWMMASPNTITFFAGATMGILFMALGIMTLYLVSSRSDIGWPFSIFFFSMNILNALYSFFFSASAALVLYSVSSMAGLLLSVYNVDSSVRNRIHRVQSSVEDMRRSVRGRVKSLKATKLRRAAGRNPLKVSRS